MIKSSFGDKVKNLNKRKPKHIYLKQFDYLLNMFLYQLPGKNPEANNIELIIKKSGLYKSRKKLFDNSDFDKYAKIYQSKKNTKEYVLYSHSDKNEYFLFLYINLDNKVEPLLLITEKDFDHILIAKEREKISETSIEFLQEYRKLMGDKCKSVAQTEIRNVIGDFLVLKNFFIENSLINALGMILAKIQLGMKLGEYLKGTKYDIIDFNLNIDLLDYLSSLSCYWRYGVISLYCNDCLSSFQLTPTNKSFFKSGKICKLCTSGSIGEIIWKKFLYSYYIPKYWDIIESINIEFQHNESNKRERIDIMIKYADGIKTFIEHQGLQHIEKVCELYNDLYKKETVFSRHSNSENGVVIVYSFKLQDFNELCRYNTVPNDNEFKKLLNQVYGTDEKCGGEYWESTKVITIDELKQAIDSESREILLETIHEIFRTKNKKIK